MMTRISIFMILTVVSTTFFVLLAQGSSITDIPLATTTVPRISEAPEDTVATTSPFTTLVSATSGGGTGGVLKDLGVVSEEISEDPEGNSTVVTKKAASLTSEQIAAYLFADFILLCFAALFAGLTLSVMGLDTLSLEIIASSGQEPDRAYARKILPIRKLGNQLLCTLILGNVMVNTLVAQITDKIFAGWVATLMSTVLITVGGEIIPQATMSAHALYVGSKSAPAVWFFLIAFYPICKPLAVFLNFVVGQDPGQIYERNELKRLMTTHAKDHGQTSGLGEHELGMMMGALEIHEKTVVDVMTPIHKVFMLEANTVLNEATLSAIWESGRSRIPIYTAPNRSDTVGILFAKDLIGVDPSEETKAITLVNFYNRTQHFVPEETKLVSVLKYFQSGRSHMAFVKGIHSGVYYKKDPVYELLGIVTLEDVIEEFIHGEIFDEHDNEKEKLDHATAVTGGALAGGLDAESKAKELEQQLVLMVQLPGHPSQGAISGSLTVGGSSGGTTLIGAVRYSSWQSSYQHKSTAMYLRDESEFFQQWPSQDHVSELLRTDCTELAANSTALPASLLSARIWEVRPRSNASTLPLDDKKNIWLYRQGQQSNCVIVILSGKVEVIVRQEKQVQKEQKGVVGKPRSGSVRSKSPSAAGKNVSFAGAMGLRAGVLPPLVDSDKTTAAARPSPSGGGEGGMEEESFVIELGPNSVIGTAGLDVGQQEKKQAQWPMVDGFEDTTKTCQVTAFTPQYSCRAISSVKYVSFTLDAYAQYKEAK